MFRRCQRYFACTHCDVLGLREGATTDEIRVRYRELVKKHHPDVEGGNEDTFKRIQASYSALLHARGARDSQQTWQGAADNAKWEYWAENSYPPQDKEDVKRHHQERKEAERRMYLWILRKTVAVVLSLWFVSYVGYLCGQELRNPTQLPDNANDNPKFFTLHKTRHYEPVPSYYERVKAEQQEVLEKAIKPLQEKMAQHQQANGTYAVRYRGQSYTAHTPTAPGVRHNPSPTNVYGIHGTEISVGDDYEDEYASD
eukprot:PhM_4_TR13593/c0_g1_i2/m.63699